LFSRLPSVLWLALTIFVGAQLAVAQVHCGLLTGGDDHDCALCHTGQVQFVDAASALTPVPEPPAGRVAADETASPSNQPKAERLGRAPPFVL